MVETALEKLGLKYQRHDWYLYVIHVPENTSWPEIHDILAEIAGAYACDSYE